MDELLGSIGALREAYRRRRVSSVEVTRELLAQAERLQPVLNAFITLTPERALARGDGERLTLLGIPITLKDLYNQSAVPTTAGSALRREAVAEAAAAAPRRRSRPESG